MPDLTPPWDRIPSYITSFQSSPVRIWENTAHNLKNLFHCCKHIHAWKAEFLPTVPGRGAGTHPGRVADPWQEHGSSLNQNNHRHAVPNILRYPRLLSLVTDLKHGHDGCRKGVKVCRRVVFKDEPVTGTGWAKRWEGKAELCLTLFCSGRNQFSPSQERLCSMHSVSLKASLCAQLPCTHF